MNEKAIKLAREAREATVKMWQAHHRKNEREFELAYKDAYSLLTQIDVGLYAAQPADAPDPDEHEARRYNWDRWYEYDNLAQEVS